MNYACKRGAAKVEYIILVGLLILGGYPAISDLGANTHDALCEGQVLSLDIDQDGEVSCSDGIAIISAQTIALDRRDFNCDGRASDNDFLIWIERTGLNECGNG